MLVHEMAGIESYYPYLAYRVRPVPVQMFIGRTSKEWPYCKVKDSIWHWFKDLFGQKQLFHTSHVFPQFLVSENA